MDLIYHPIKDLHIEGYCVFDEKGGGFHGLHIIYGNFKKKIIINKIFDIKQLLVFYLVVYILQSSQPQLTSWIIMRSSIRRLQVGFQVFFIVKIHIHYS